MRYRPAQGIEPCQRVLDRFHIRERVAEEHPVRFNDLPQLSEVGIVEEVGRARRHATLYLPRAVLGCVVAHHLRYELGPPVRRLLLHQPRPDQIANGVLQAVEELVMLRHDCGVMTDALRYLRVVRVACTLGARGAELDFFSRATRRRSFSSATLFSPKYLMACSITTSSAGCL